MHTIFKTNKQTNEKKMGGSSNNTNEWEENAEREKFFMRALRSFYFIHLCVGRSVG